MLMLTITGTVVGSLLAQRYKMFILIPVVGFTMLIVAVKGIALGDSIWVTAGAMAVVATAIQFGYVGGVLLHLVVDALVGRRRARVSKSTSISGSF